MESNRWKKKASRAKNTSKAEKGEKIKGGCMLIRGIELLEEGERDGKIEQNKMKQKLQGKVERERKIYPFLLLCL